MLKELDKAFFVDGTSSSGPGMINCLFENNVRYLLIEEIDKLSRKDQSILLNLMENNILIETKVGKTRKNEMKVSVFATCNEIRKNITAIVTTRKLIKFRRVCWQHN
jgi:hypothetical protein